MVVVHTQLVEREWTIDGEWKFDWMNSCGGCAYTTGREGERGRSVESGSLTE